MIEVGDHLVDVLIRLRRLLIDQRAVLADHAAAEPGSFEFGDGEAAFELIPCLAAAPFAPRAMGKRLQRAVCKAGARLYQIGEVSTRSRDHDRPAISGRRALAV